MRRRNHRTKPIETLKKTVDLQFPDPSSSRAHSDLKRRRKVSFDCDDVDHRSPLNESQAGKSFDAKTSEFAFFKKLKSGFGLSSESTNPKSSNRVEQYLKTFEFRSKPGGKNPEYAGTDREAKDGCKSYSFSTPIHNTREKDSRKASSVISRDKDTVRSGGIGDEKGDLFYVKRKRLHQWVKDTWFPEIFELTSNGGDLVSVLLTRLFPGTEETHLSRFSKERTDRVKRRTFLDSPGSKFLKSSHERYTEVDNSLRIERDRSISRRGWLENSIEPSLQFATGHVIPRDNFPISYPKESVYRPPLLRQKASLSFPVEETPECSLHFRNYKPLSLDYQIEESGYSSEDLSYDHRESSSSALLLEWNTETASTRKTDDLPLSYHTEAITYPNASLIDNPWSSDYSSSHDLVTRELYPLPPGSFLLPTTNQTSYFEHELERHVIDDEDVVVANPNLQTFHHTYSSDCSTRDYTYYQPVDHCHFKVPGCEIVSFPFSSISDLNSIQASSPTVKSRDWIPFKFQSPRGWIDL